MQGFSSGVDLVLKLLGWLLEWSLLTGGRLHRFGCIEKKNFIYEITMLQKCFFHEMLMLIAKNEKF
jgi:hypothetical protein